VKPGRANPGRDRCAGDCLNTAGDEGKDHMTVRAQRIRQADRRADFGARKVVEGKGDEDDLMLGQGRDLRLLANRHPPPEPQGHGTRDFEPLLAAIHPRLSPQSKGTTQ